MLLLLLLLLQWNPEDKEFNCPCHGSCFSAKGENLAGPATIDMTRIDKD
jgi:Rieske Fe-S protein